MPCYHPLTGFRQLDGKVKFNHSQGGSFSDRQVTVPCGQCFGCRLERSRVWATRIVHEAQFHEKNSFLTLTYDDEHLPDDGGLNVKHWQNFAKKVRNKLGQFRFYHCGEYGGERLRPHYHACIFGLDFSEDRETCAMSGDFPLYKSKQLDDCWENGHAWIGNLTFETAAYVARYVMEKLTGERAIEYGGIKPDYATMSNRPGIGAKWYETYGTHAHHLDSIALNGTTMPMPAYYDKLLEKDRPEELARLKTIREEKAKRWESDQTPERLRVRETVAKAGVGYNPRHTNDLFIRKRERRKPGIPGSAFQNR